MCLTILTILRWKFKCFLGRKKILAEVCRIDERDLFEFPSFSISLFSVLCLCEWE